MKIKIESPCGINIETSGGIQFLRKLAFWALRQSRTAIQAINIDGVYEVIERDDLPPIREADHDRA